MHSFIPREVSYIILLAVVTQLTLVDGLYEETVFQGTDVIDSATFAKLDLTAAQVLTAGQV